MSKTNAPRRVIILGAAGRDFHNFNLVFRDDPASEVVAFTGTQIPGIAGRRYPAALAGPLYPDGIPIEEESELETLIGRHARSLVVFAYSDVAHAEVMHLASRALAAGADFALLGPNSTMLQASVPVIAVSAVRTGCGKSQTARWIAGRLRARGLRVAVIRHPMPYGDLESAAVQRFASYSDLDRHHCSIEEREEFEPHLASGGIVYAGVDYARIVEHASAEADVILWDGGNNDFPFVRPDLHVVLVDALRPGNETTHHPGETVLRMADIVLIAKSEAASTEFIDQITRTIRLVNLRARIIRANSPVTLDNPDSVRGKRVIVLEDGPTITHGGMAHGAGYVAALRANVREVVDPRPFAPPAIAAVYVTYPHIGPVLPAVGYSPIQIAALHDTIEHAKVDAVIAATPIDFAHLVNLGIPVVRARYEFAEAERPGLGDAIDAFTSGIDGHMMSGREFFES